VITQDKDTETIELTNIGPNERLVIQCPKGGGIIELHGTNDLGKSEALDAIDSALNNRGGIEVRRGCVAGSLSAFGVNVKIGKRMTRTGEAVVESLEGRFSIEDLIEPKLKDPLAADAKRIKTLIQVKGAAATADVFYPLLGGKEEFESIVSKTAVDSEDFVVMAERVKRDIESAARKLEEQAKHEDGHAQGALAATSGVDMDGESDAKKLQAAHERAVRRDSELTTRATAHKDAKIAARKAADAIGDAEATHTGPTLAAATVVETTAKQHADEAQAEVGRLETLLRDAKTSRDAANVAYSNALTARKSAEQHESTLATWREQVAASIPEAPTDAEIVAASEAVTKALEALERGAIIRRARDSKANADRHAELATQHRQKAMRLRDAAKGTDDILSGLVASAGTPLRVEAGRLMYESEKGTKTYAELSHGLRSRIALGIAIEAVGPGGVICLKQEFWEGVAPAKRKELAEYVRGKNVLVLTARATDDEVIHAEAV